MTETHPVAAAAAKASAAIKHDSSNVGSTLVNFFDEIEAFFKHTVEPAIAVAEKVVPIAEAIDPAITPEVAAAEAAVSGVENVVDHL